MKEESCIFDKEEAAKTPGHYWLKLFDIPAHLAFLIERLKEIYDSASTHFIKGDIVKVIEEKHMYFGLQGEVIKEVAGVVTVRIKGLKKDFEIGQLMFVKMRKL